MTYSPTLIVHIVAGMIGVVSGMTSLLVRKGSRLHKRSGDVFVVSMMFMAAGGAYIALLKSQRFNILAGVLTFYLVSTALLIVVRKANKTGWLEVGLMLGAIAAGITAWSFAYGAQKRGFAIGYAIFGSIGFLCAAGDLRMLIRGGLEGAQRIARHLWRMGFALFVASGSFFLGTAGDPVMRKSGLRATLFTPEVRATHLPQVPVLLVVVLTLYWLIRVLVTDKYKKLEAGRSTTARVHAHAHDVIGTVPEAL